jgi:TM2 domain-containing membrane protein YozV
MKARFLTLLLGICSFALMSSTTPTANRAVQIPVAKPEAKFTPVPVEMNSTAQAITKSTKKALRAEAKAQRKAARAAKHLAWMTRLASDPNWAAVILAFFLGWLGIHRVVMGGSGLLIIGYLFTFGGFFGILPLVDFIRLIIDSSHYEDNDALFRAFQN